MKPLSLVIQAFSTYLEKTEIDFTRLNSQGLYLISGETGAGKTTIFDAICYALYGETSGSNRGNDVFRCQFADVSTPTVVDFKFELNHQVYEARRSLVYTKSGRLRQNHDDTAIYLPDGTMLTGKKQVNEKIKDLLQVDASQFKQIVMIAQGEFSKLLTASSKDKEKIFRDIFHTERLKALEESLGEQTKVLREQTVKINSQLTGLLKSIDQEATYDIHTLELLKKDIDEAQEKFNALKDTKQIQDQKLEALQDHYRQVQSRNEKVLAYQKAQEAYQILQSQKEEYDKLATTIKRIEEAKDLQVFKKEADRRSDEYQALEEKAQDLNAAFTKLEEEIKAFASEKQVLPQLSTQITKLNVELSELEKSQQIKEEYDFKREEKEKLSAMIIAYSKKEQHLHNDYMQCEESIAKNNHLLEEESSIREALTNNISHLTDLKNNRIQKLNEAKDQFDTLSRLEEDYRSAYHDYKDAKKQADEAEEHYETLRQMRMHNTAGILASTLKEGEACPVCGSLHHPHLAAIEGKHVSEEEIDRAEKKEQDQKDILNVKASDKDMKKGLADAARDNLKKSCQALAIAWDREDQDPLKDVLTKQLFEANEEYESLNKLSNDYQSKLEELALLKERQKKEQNLLKKDEEDLRELGKKLATAKQKVASLEERIDVIASSYPNLDQIEEKKKDLVKTLQKVEENKEQIETKDSLMAKRQTKLSTQIDDTNKRLQTLHPQVTKAQKTFSEAVEKQAMSLDEFHYFGSLIPKLEASIKKRDTYLSRLHSAQGALETTKGQAGNGKIEDLSQLNSRIEAFKEKKKHFDEDYNALDYSLQARRETYQSMQSLDQKYQHISDQYNRYYHLYQMISGKNDAKTSFERYVLQAYFQMVLQYANVELKRLTDERYEFIISDQTNGNAGAGLDLDVIDYQSGESRQVNSLSGGEQFKAALALALGLSQMIQSQSGGIELNALFIDEGFGTLDGESLETAIDVLIDMKSDNKVIGIISHVGELENRIDAKIEVTKGFKGSHLQVIV